MSPVNLSTFSIHDIPIIAWPYGSHDYRLWNSSTSFYKKGCFNKSHTNDFCWYTKTSTKRDDEWKNNFIFMVKKRNWGNVCVQPRNAKHTDTSVDSRRGVTKYVASRMHTNAIIIMADWLASPDIEVDLLADGLRKNSILLRHFPIFNPEITRCLSTIILLCCILVLLE